MAEDEGDKDAGKELICVTKGIKDKIATLRWFWSFWSGQKNLPTDNLKSENTCEEEFEDL